MAAAPETGGATLAAVPGAAAQTAVGSLMVVGAVKNAQALENTPYHNTPENQERMSQGKAPVGKDESRLSYTIRAKPVKGT